MVLSAPFLHENFLLLNLIKSMLLLLKGRNNIVHLDWFTPFSKTQFLAIKSLTYFTNTTFVRFFTSIAFTEKSLGYITKGRVVLRVLNSRCERYC